MASNADIFLKKTLGNDFFESLTKFELWKPGTRTVVDHEEIKTALQIVPRVLMAVLIRELSAMAVGETKEIHLPVKTVPALIRTTKHEKDVYSGEILHENKMVVDFKYRSIPGVGLIIMSAFELYDTSELIKENPNQPSEDNAKKIQDLIDERLALHDLIDRVVDKKLAERDAIQQLFLAKLSESLNQKEQAPTVIVELNQSEPMSADTKKELPLRKFLEIRKTKLDKKEFSISLAKNENVSCPSCGQDIFKNQVFSGCICLGNDREKKIFIKKSEDGVKVRFGKGWDPENIEMLLEVFRRKRG